MDINKNQLTNRFLSQGFGEHYQNIIYATIEAELTNKEFIYTPMTACGNITSPEDLERREAIMNVKYHFPCNYDREWQKMHEVPHRNRGIFNFDPTYMKLCFNSLSLQILKTLFRKGKNKTKYFDDGYFNVAIHIRRYSNEHDNAFINISNRIYLFIIDALKNYYKDKKLLFHVYSEGNEELFRNDFIDKDIVLHINQSDVDSFISMGLADVLVASTSSFSFSAGFMSEGEVFYFPCWYSVLPNWKAMKIPGFRRLLMQERDAGTWVEWDSVRNCIISSGSQLFAI